MLFSSLGFFVEWLSAYRTWLRWSRNEYWLGYRLVVHTKKTSHRISCTVLFIRLASSSCVSDYGNEDLSCTFFLTTFFLLFYFVCWTDLLVVVRTRIAYGRLCQTATEQLIAVELFTRSNMQGDEVLNMFRLFVYAGWKSVPGELMDETGDSKPIIFVTWGTNCVWLQCWSVRRIVGYIRAERPSGSRILWHSPLWSVC